jgi:hypothetical protein
MLAGVDEPVRRYFSHAISHGASLTSGVRMAMSGRIRVGLWLPFTAEQTVDGRSFTWRARVGRGPLTPLRVIDRYADAAGSTEGRLLGRLTLFHAQDVNTARSAATRAAIESVVFAPPSVLPGRGAAWRAETENVIVARFDLPPERPGAAAQPTAACHASGNGGGHAAPPAARSCFRPFKRTSPSSCVGRSLRTSRPGPQRSTTTGLEWDRR